MKRILSISLALALVLSFTVVTTTPVVAATTWYVDDNNCPGPGSGTVGDPFCTIQAAVSAASSGDIIMVAAGTYSEGIALTAGKNLKFVGAGRDVVTWIGPSAGACISGSMSGYAGSMSYEISGFTFNCRSVAATTWGAGILINRASSGPLSLSIHDNRFIEDRASGDDTHWATSMLLCHNRYATRDGSGNPAVRIYNNIDETWGGMTMSNCQAFDIYNNTFDGCSDAIYNGHGCPDVAGQTFGDHHIYGNTFKNASDALHPSGLTPAIDWQYYGSGGGTHLASIIENNSFEDNDTAIRFVMGTSMTYPAHIIRNNCFSNNGMALRIDGTYASTVNAEDNWWGDDTGPSGAGPGSGDPVTSNVDFDPWLGGPASDSTTTGTGTASFATNDGCIPQLAAVPTPPSPPVTLPHGVFNFTICCLTGSTATLGITFPDAIPVGYKWWKYVGGTWYCLDIGSDDGDDFITVTLQDNVLPDDEDTILGQITDQGGPGPGGAVGWETYPINKVRVLLPWIALAAAVMAGIVILARRRRTEN
jgi:hypothetical protein